MRRILFTVLALVAAAAQAQAPDDAAFRDYHSMLKHLRSNGIEPAAVAWNEIEPLCVGFMNYRDDQTEYNRCRFDKAVLQYSFRGDSDVCDVEAASVTPESMRRTTRVVIGTYTPEGDSLTTVKTPTITRSELRVSRAAAFNRCMADKGWRNPRNWRLGFAQ